MDLTFQQAVDKLQELINTYGLEAVQWRVAMTKATYMFDCYRTKDLAEEIVKGRAAITSNAHDLVAIDLGFVSEDWDNESAEAFTLFITEWSDLLSSK